jgi:hydroxypyruvate isomerase
MLTAIGLSTRGENELPKWSANLSMLFGEVPFLDRFEAAAAAGFRAVEVQFPYDLDVEALVRRLSATGLRLDMFNLPAGDFAAGERGLASLATRSDEFRGGVDTAIAYARATGTTRLNCLVGLRDESASWEAQEACLVDNLRWAVERLGDHGIALTLEQLCPQEAPGFFLSSLDVAERVLDDVGGGLRLQFDVYHVQRAHGDVTAHLRRLFARIGHVQIADSPGRGEPGTGELHFPFILGELDRLGYPGRVGLEYRPTGPTTETLSWIEAQEWRRDD